MRYCILMLVGTLLFHGCLKEDNGCNNSINIIAPASEQAELERYLTANNVSALKHNAGFYYKIIELGSGGNPNPCSTIKVGYTGSLTDGVVFEKNNQVFLRLDVLIPGWILSLPYLSKGGRMKIYIPPALGYKNSEKRNDNGVIIPPNSILIYDINLIDFQ